MSTLLEIEAVADTLPPEQQAELVTFLTARLARTSGTSDGRDNDGMDLEQEFLRLTQQWRAETELSSSLTEMAAHPAYQRIIGMGRLALPMIFRDLAAEPDHWFWALKAITGCDPVPPAHRGNIEMMATDWLAWGKSRGYVQP